MMTNLFMNRTFIGFAVAISLASTNAFASLPVAPLARPSGFTPVDAQPFFDIPVTYNVKVKQWITYFQNPGKKWYHTRLERSHRYLPIMKRLLRERSMPQDLA